MTGFGNEPIILTDADELGRVGAATLISHNENHWTVLLSNTKYNTFEMAAHYNGEPGRYKVICDAKS